MFYSEEEKILFKPKGPLNSVPKVLKKALTKEKWIEKNMLKRFRIIQFYS